MAQLFQYYSRLQGIRGGFGTLPPWGRSLVGIFALPGILLAILSLLLFMVSILALLLLTLPIYRLIQAVTGQRGRVEIPATVGELFAGDLSPGAKRVDVRVVE